MGGKGTSTADKASLFQTLRTTRSEDEVLAVITQLEEGGQELNVKDYTSILAALKRFKNWKQALEVFGRMRENGVEPNAITYNAVMGACGAAGRWKETQELFQTMTRRGLRPDAVSFGSLMIGLVRGGQWEQALDVLGNESFITRTQAAERTSAKASAGAGKPGDELAGVKHDKTDALKNLNPVNRQSGAVKAESLVEEYSEVVDRYFKAITK